MSKAGVAPKSAEVHRARTFLVRAQGEDGIWIVPTTKHPKEDKPADKPTAVSNYWGTAWAVVGLSHTLPVER